MKGSDSEESEYIRIGKTVVQKVQKLMLVSILSGSSNRGVKYFLDYLYTYFMLWYNQESQ